MRARAPAASAAATLAAPRVKNYRPAEVVSFRPGIARTCAHSDRLRARDMVEAARFVAFALDCQPSLDP